MRNFAPTKRSQKVVLAAALTLVVLFACFTVYRSVAGPELSESTPDRTFETITPVHIDSFIGRDVSSALKDIGTPGVDNSMPSDAVIKIVQFPQSGPSISGVDNSDLIVTGYCLPPGLKILTLSAAVKHKSPLSGLASMQEKFCPDGSVSGFARNPNAGTPK